MYKSTRESAIVNQPGINYPQSSLPYQPQTLIKENIRPRPKNLFFFSWWPQIRDLCAEFLRLLKLRHKLVFGRSPRSWSVSLARHILWVTSLVFLYCSSKSQGTWPAWPREQKNPSESHYNLCEIFRTTLLCKLAGKAMSNGCRSHSTPAHSTQVATLHTSPRLVSCWCLCNPPLSLVVWP